MEADGADHQDRGHHHPGLLNKLLKNKQTKKTVGHFTSLDMMYFSSKCKRSYLRICCLGPEIVMKVYMEMAALI